MTLQHEIIEVDVGHLLEAAQKRAESLGALSGSMRGIQASQVGCLGELVGMEYLEGVNVSFAEIFSTTHDLSMKVHGQDKTMELKAKERTARPRETFDCTTPDYNKDHQRPDYYLFISLLSTGGKDIHRFTKGYILGSIGRRKFDRIAKFWQPSDTDKSNGWKPTIACWNVTVTDLTPPKRKGDLS